MGSLPRWTTVAVPAVLLALGAAVYASGNLPLHYSLVRYFGVDPTPVPFADTEAILRVLRCARQGFDMVAANPCADFDYSPFWLVLAIFPVTAAWSSWAGWAVNAAFVASLALLPAPRDRAGMLAMAAAAGSSAVVFGIERANMDLLLFALVVAACALLVHRWQVRLAGYALLFAAGLLKYYPMAGMAIALRERVGRFTFVALVALAATAALLALYWSDFSRALHNIPTGYPLGNMFGSVTLGLAVVEEAHLPPGWVRLIHWPMIAAGLGFGVLVGLRPQMQAALETLTPRESRLLLVGALLIGFCFFSAQNIGYRAVFLLMVLPGLLALRRFGPARRFAHAPWWALALMWHQLWLAWPAWGAGQLGGKVAHDGMQYLVCAVREVIWWSLMVVLIGYLTAFVVHSPLGQGLRACWARIRSAVAKALPNA